MSMFERPSEDSQLFSAPEPRKRSWRSWPRIISAFAAGVACTFLIVTFSRESAPPLEQLGKSAKIVQSAEPSKVGELKTPPAPPAPEATTTQSGAAAPTPPAQSPVPSQDTQRTTDGSAPARETPNERAAAAEEPARSRDSGTVTKQTPDAAPKPKAVTPSEPAASRAQVNPSSGTDAANSQEAITERSSINEQRAREARQAQRAAKARERQARRDAERSDKRRTVRSEDAQDGESRAAFDDDSRWVRDDTRGPFRDDDEIRRPTREAPVRGARKRSDPADEEDREVIVRSQRSRDGRQRAVYEEPRREREIETRRVISEEPARPRIPFIFDLFGGGPRD